MQTYNPPVGDYRILLEALGYDRVAQLKGHEDYDLETTMALIEQGGVFAKERMLPMNQIGDQKGLQFDPATGEVKTPKGFTALYKDFCAQGYPSLGHSTEFGGGGAPHTLAAPFNEFFCAANKSFTMASGLSFGLIEALEAHADDELKQRYLPKLISGEWTGTMCLTEPQCGTDLGLLTTKAVPDGDAYKLTGTKIWITFGEHDFTDNIIHLVLARLPDAPEGIKGISTFVVPKFTPDGKRNGIVCGGLEHKLGIHASPTCVMNMEDATGYLVGVPHKGMRAMFTMMNNARLMVGIEGFALADIAYQTSVAFCRDRRQGRSLNSERTEPNEKADNILVHPDVRRQLLNVRSTNEGMRALATWIAMQIDIAHKSDDEKEAGWANDLVSLMTPVIKGFCTERGFANISDAMQVMGGAGYTTDWCVEQYMRDERIAMIYEGTNHVQALDLVGRKLARKNGQLYRTFAKNVGVFLEKNEGRDDMKDIIGPFKEAVERLHEVTMAMGMRGIQDMEYGAAVASNYLTLFGLVAVGYAWCMVIAGIEGKAGAAYDTKRKLAKYYMEQILVERHAYDRLIEVGKDNMMAFADEEF